jgi:small-conductance mechanosensitive channel
VDAQTAARQYPVRLSIDYPDRELNRATTFFRIIVAIPIFIVVASVSGWGWGGGWGDGGGYGELAGAAGGLVIFAPLVMILFRRKYPRWWFDWNLNLFRFQNRVLAYLALMDDRYPSTDEEQAIHIEIDYPDARRDLNRWLPLVKWLLAIPHFIVLVLLAIATFFVVIFAWFAILFTGRYPRGLFDFVEGVFRWSARVEGYALLIVTDRYPPFSLQP